MHASFTISFPKERKGNNMRLEPCLPRFNVLARKVVPDLAENWCSPRRFND